MSFNLLCGVNVLFGSTIYQVKDVEVEEAQEEEEGTKKKKKKKSDDR